MESAEEDSPTHHHQPHSANTQWSVPGRPASAGLQGPMPASAGISNRRQTVSQADRLAAQRLDRRVVFNAAETQLNSLASLTKKQRIEVLKLMASEMGFALVPTRSVPVVVGSTATAVQPTTTSTQVVDRVGGKARRPRQPPQPRAEWKKDPTYRRIAAERDQVVTALKECGPTDIRLAGLKESLATLTGRLVQAKKDARSAQSSS